MPLQAPEDGRLFPPYRVLDLSGPEAVFCGKLLADYGADVVRVEPPGGDPSRSFGPFAQDQEGPDRSLYFLFYNTNKRSITLNIQTERGKELFRRLVADADVIVESYPVGYLDSLGLGYESLREINPGIVMASVTPFGQTGPWKDYKSNDLIALAASGFMQITGEPDGPPMRQGNDQSHFPGAQYAAASILGALYHRDFNGGEGQHIDVSLQEALITYYTDAHPALAWMLLGDNVTRVGATSTLVIPLGAYPSADGWISAGIITPREWDTLAQWIYEMTGNEEVLNDAYRGGNQDRAPYNDIITAMVIDFTTRYHQRVPVPRRPAPQPCRPAGEYSLGPAGRSATRGRATSGSASTTPRPARRSTRRVCSTARKSRQPPEPAPRTGPGQRGRLRLASWASPKTELASLKNEGVI